MRIPTLLLASLLVLGPLASHAEPLTRQQQGMYWRSLSRMMESGRTEEEIHFRGRTMTVSFIAGQTYEPQPGMLCRPFTQRITRSAAGPYRQGYACRTQGGWCRQMTGGGEWQCPPEIPSSVARSFRDARIDWRNFKSGISNGINRKIGSPLPF